MRIILRKDVEKLGKMGEVVNVKNGYARNYLIPNDIAFIAKAGAMRRLEIEKTKQATQIEKVKTNALELANKIRHVLNQLNKTKMTEEALDEIEMAIINEQNLIK